VCGSNLRKYKASATDELSIEGGKIACRLTDLVLFERGQVKAGELFEIHGDVSFGRGGARRAMMRSYLLN